jgi:hypothetical protein
MELIESSLGVNKKPVRFQQEETTSLLPVKAHGFETLLLHGSPE